MVRLVGTARRHHFQLTGYVVHYAELAEGETEPRPDAWQEVRVGPEVNKHQLAALKPKVDAKEGKGLAPTISPSSPSQTVYWVRLQAVSDRGPGVISVRRENNFTDAVGEGAGRGQNIFIFPSFRRIRFEKPINSCEMYAMAVDSH